MTEQEACALASKLMAYHGATGEDKKSHLAELVADRGRFVVAAGKVVAAYDDEAGVWIVGDADGAVSRELESAIDAVNDDLATVLDAEADSDDDETAPQKPAYVSVSTKATIRDKLLPDVLHLRRQVLKPTPGAILCKNGARFKEGEIARQATLDDHFTCKTGFDSTALTEEPVGFAEWHPKWTALKGHTTIDMAIGRALVMGKPVRGDVDPQRTLRKVVEETVGGYKLCLPGQPAFLSGLTPPAGTSPPFLAHAALLAMREAPPDVMDTDRLSEVVGIAEAVTPPHVLACHILYSRLRTSAAAREEPKSHIVKLQELKAALAPAGVYASSSAIQDLINRTFTEPRPLLKDANCDRGIKSSGWVVIGVELGPAVSPPHGMREWTPRCMFNVDSEVAALLPEQD